MVNLYKSRHEPQEKNRKSRHEPHRKKRFMTRIANAAEYRYFSFTGYYFGKASFGLAQQG